MNESNSINLIPYDSIALGMKTYEIHSLSPMILDEVIQSPGHYSIKINPLASKQMLHEYGFYYCDTLIEPFCNLNNLICFADEKVSISRDIPLNELLNLSRNVFDYGRFHRDFNINKEMAELRYLNWLKQLHELNSIYFFYYSNELAGFVAFDKNKLVLHALNQQHRGKRLAKYFWSKVCKELFSNGYTELTSSVSAANLPVVNLYASLGFRFRNSVDVYHRLVK